MIISEFLKILVFPGFFFILAMAITFGWLYRKLVALMENRIGPPFNQPAYDVAKLMAKERIYPAESIKWINQLLPRVQVLIALSMALFIPINGTRGIISFEGDIFVFLFLLTLHGSTTFFIGWSSRSPYSVSGAGRAVLTEISLEIPMALSIAGIAILTEELSISGISTSLSINQIQENTYAWLFILPFLTLLIVMLYATLGALEYNPFSAAHAETEIVSGWNTELTGSDLAFTKLAELITFVNLVGLITAIFLGGVWPFHFEAETIFSSILIGSLSTLIILLKMIFVVFLLAFISTTSGRLRIDQTTNVLWNYFLPLSLISILGIMIIKMIGGG